MKIVDFYYPKEGLDTFDSYLSKFNKISKDSPMPNSLAVMYLKSATHGNTQSLSAWAQWEAVTEIMRPNTNPKYDKYFE